MCGGASDNAGVPMQEMWEIQLQSLGQEEPLQEGMATHSSIPAWRIPWTEESGRPQSRVAQSQTQLKRLSTAHGERKRW